MYRNPESKIEIKDAMDANDVHVLLARALEFPDQSVWDRHSNSKIDSYGSLYPELQ